METCRTKRKIGLIYVICAAVSLVGLFRSVYIYVVVEREQRASSGPKYSIQLKYEPLVKLVPSSIRQVGYLTDRRDILPFNDAHFLQANYAFAPKIVVPSIQNLPYVLVDFDQPPTLEELQSKYGLVPLMQIKPGFGLFSRALK